jgi:hypothetical protein
MGAPAIDLRLVGAAGFRFTQRLSAPGFVFFEPRRTRHRVMKLQEGANAEVGSGQRVRTGCVLLAYLVPLLLLVVFYLPIGAGGYVFLRNWLRAGCGPVAQAMCRAGFDPNDLATYATAFALLWPLWLLVLFLTPVHRLPLAVHGFLGFLWCFGGCFFTLAI